MAIEDKQAKLMQDALAIKHYFKVESPDVKAGFDRFAQMYESDYSTDELYDVLNDIEGAIEDLCLANHISQESLEAMMEDNSDWENEEL